MWDNEERRYVRWQDLEPKLSELFAVWTGRPERQWARAVWELLERAGHSRAEDYVQYDRVLVRMLAVAVFYHTFAQLTWEEGFPEIEVWSANLGISRARLLQSLEPGFRADVPDDEESLLDAAFDEVFGDEYRAVAGAVIDGFGGPSETFVALWFSRDPDWAGRRDIPDDMRYFTLNEVTGGKMAGFHWLEIGAPHPPH